MQSHLTLAVLPTSPASRSAPAHVPTPAASSHAQPAVLEATRMTAMPIATVADFAPPPAEPCFDFDDLQALRDEYEERIRKLERDRDVQLDVMRREHDNRLMSMARDHAQRIAVETEARTELIHELTHELAAAREEGDEKVRAADARCAALASKLQTALAETARLAGDVARLHASLTSTLQSLAPAPFAHPHVSAPLVHEVSDGAVVHAMPSDTRKRKIRLR